MAQKVPKFHSGLKDDAFVTILLLGKIKIKLGLNSRKRARQRTELAGVNELR